MEQKDFSNFGRGSPKKHFYGIILKLVHGCRRRCHLKVFLFITLGAILYVEQNDLSNFGRGSPKEHFCEIILKSVLWSRRRCHLKVLLFLALAAILFSRAERF